MHIGLAVTSHAGPAVSAEAKFSYVSVAGEVEPEGEFVWSEDIDFQIVTLPRNRSFAKWRLGLCSSRKSLV